MVENQYYSLGEVMDNLQQGKLAISIHGETKEFSTVVGLDPQGWAWIKYPGKEYAQYSFGFRVVEGAPTKRLTMINVPENFEVKILDGLNIKKYIYKNGKPYEVEKEAIIKDDESEEN